MKFPSFSCETCDNAHDVMLFQRRIPTGLSGLSRIFSVNHLLATKHIRVHFHTSCLFDKENTFCKVMFASLDNKAFF